MEINFENTCKDEQPLTQLSKDNAELVKENTRLKKRLDAKDTEIAQITKHLVTSAMTPSILLSLMLLSFLQYLLSWYHLF